jgi:broad-like protein
VCFPQLAQVQSLVRSQQSTPTTNHHPSFTEKLVEDALFTSPSSPPHGATVNQLLRRAAMQHRRERRISSDPDSEHKRPRSDHIIGNNNNNELNLSHTQPPQTQPADFSPSAMKNNALNLNLNTTTTHKSDQPLTEGNNGITSSERENSPCSPSPTLNSRLNEDNVKSEPMDLLCSTNPDENSNDSGEVANDNGPNNLPQGPHSGSSAGDHDDHDSPIGPYLTPSESKLFATAAGSFNFSMAALAADPTGLGGLNQSLQANADSLAGTSQGTVRMPPPTSGGINEPQECPYCRRTFSCYYSLKRHFQDKHEQSDTLYVCEFCHRRYRTKNSLTTHKSLQHRGSSGMLKRLLKTTAIKSVLGTPPPPRLQ